MNIQALHRIPRPFHCSILLGIVALVFGPTLSTAIPCGSWEATTATPNPGSTSNRFVDVTTLGPDQVLALGKTAQDRYFAARWDGSIWTEVALPDPAEFGIAYDLDALVSAPGGHVWAVGIVALDVWNSKPLAMRYNGEEWDIIEAVPMVPESAWPHAERYGRATAASAVSDNDIWAVGNATGFGDGVTGSPGLLIHWDGSEWSEFFGEVPGDRQNNLFDVAAVAADDVWAVGEFSNWHQDPLGFYGMILHWDGSAWSHFPNPAQNLVDSHLNEITAAGPNDVWVAGRHGLDHLFMHWDGVSWSVVAGPPVEGYVREMEATTSGNVWLSATLPEQFYHWDGLVWTPVEPPAVPGASNANHGGGFAVLGECDIWSVGGYLPDDSGWTRTFAEHLTSGGSVAALPEVPPSAFDVHLNPNVPNPFNPRTEIRFHLPQNGPVNLTIYNAAGRRVRRLVAENRPAGDNSVVWDGRNDLGRALASGIYLTVLQAAGQQRSRQITLLK